jgi:hypothetical protein
MENLVVTNKQLASIKRGLVDGLTVASGAKSTATYYHSKDEQVQAIKVAVTKLYNQSKELPLILANQKGSTGKFIHEVLLNELKSTYNGGSCNIVNPVDWYDNDLSDKAVLGALYNLNENGIPYVLRLFEDLKKNRVNNDRTVKIVLGYIWGHPNLEFNALKYRNKLSVALKHVYNDTKINVLLKIATRYVQAGIYMDEADRKFANKWLGKYAGGDIGRAFRILLFIFKEGKSTYYNPVDYPLLSEYFKATVDVTSVTKVPEEVLLGLISNATHPQHDQMWSTELKRKQTMKLLRTKTEVTSVNQQVRQTKANKKLGVQKSVNLEKATDFMALYKTGFENGWTDELKRSIDALAEKNKITNFPYSNIGVILDMSNSMNGHKQESKNTPKAIAQFTSKVLSKSARNRVLVTTDGQTTDLASAFIKLMKQEDADRPFDAVFFITDGYENMYEGLTDEVVTAYLEETERFIPVFQISPITGAETGANVRTLGKEIVKMAINSPKALMGQINARLLEVDTKRWLENQVMSLEASNKSRYVTNNVEV